ncbi:rhoptry kinase family protein ROP21 [Besnoitia besnoiti]|uniref:Rhoptry kinase family protein ROP21 n=1 Tax=Besnoitia besnoiti TaxID=94643 RepID=A0A2A9MMR5_BESBE|nr:rhoptry kinase family protein ROP21 [Besnoitia besnoiti]PFH37751.1 rhoptry kinase family protein ROP21 [Besnoitia besnoiti]
MVMPLDRCLLPGPLRSARPPPRLAVGFLLLLCFLALLPPPLSALFLSALSSGDPAAVAASSVPGGAGGTGEASAAHPAAPPSPQEPGGAVDSQRVDEISQNSPTSESRPVGDDFNLEDDHVADPEAPIGGADTPPVPLEKRLHVARLLLEGSEAYAESFSTSDDETTYNPSNSRELPVFPQTKSTTAAFSLPVDRTKVKAMGSTVAGGSTSEEFEEHRVDLTVDHRAETPLSVLTRAPPAFGAGKPAKNRRDRDAAQASDPEGAKAPAPHDKKTEPRAGSADAAARKDEEKADGVKKAGGGAGRKLSGSDSTTADAETLSDREAGRASSKLAPQARFRRPSEALKSLITRQGTHEWPGEKEEFEQSYPFNTPIEIRSTRKGGTLTIRLEGILGSGGQGVVIEARDVNTGQGMALKVFRIRPDQRRDERKDEMILRRRVQSELAIWAYVPPRMEPRQWSDAAHLVIPFDVVEPVVPARTPALNRTRYATHWIMMDLFTGDMSQMTKILTGPPSVKLEVTEQMFLANMRLHDMGLVHSDIKMPNYFISADGRIFLGDHSLASPTGDNVPCMSGTLRYLPPENMKCISDGRRRIMTTERKDVWALGVALYMLWCNQQYPYEMGELWSKDLFVRTARAHADELDLTLCDGHATIPILGLLRVMLTPNAGRRPTLREIHKFHPIFAHPRSPPLQRRSLFSLLREVQDRNGSDLSPRSAAPPVQPAYTGLKDGQ